VCHDPFIHAYVEHRPHPVLPLAAAAPLGDTRPYRQQQWSTEAIRGSELSLGGSLQVGHCCSHLREIVFGTQVVVVSVVHAAVGGQSESRRDGQAQFVHLTQTGALLTQQVYWDGWRSLERQMDKQID